MSFPLTPLLDNFNRTDFPQTPVLDSFTRVDEGPPPSASWDNTAVGYTSIKVSSNQCVSDGAGNGIALWGTSLAADQEVYVTIAAITGSGAFAVYARTNDDVTLGQSEGYWLRTSGTSQLILASLGDTGSTLGTETGMTIAAGDSIGIRCNGDEISAWYKASGGSWTEIITATDTLWTGAGLIALQIPPSTCAADNFGGGEISFSPPSDSWTNIGDGLQLIDNTAGAVAIDGAGYWNVGTFTDCEVFATLTILPDDLSDIALFLRSDGTFDEGYVIIIKRDDTGGDTIRLVSLPITELDEISITLQAGDSFGLRAVGSSIEIFYKATGETVYTSLSVVTDTDWSAAGYIGLGSLGDTNSRMDNFSGGDPSTTTTIVVTDALTLTDSETYPLFPITDTLTLTDSIVSVVGDTLTLTDSTVVTVATIVIEDTLNLSDGEIISISGPELTPPGDETTGGLDDTIVLRLLYGNDKRSPVRTLDLSQAAPGAIRLLEGGFSPGAGELLELWSGQSIRQEGQQKLAESRDNSRLLISYVLRKEGSQAALSYFQRQINRFFLEAKLNQTQNQNHTVWLEYRWPDDLGTLPTPTFGQLNYYYEIYSAKVPKWPDNLHEILTLNNGLIEGIGVELVASPAPEGLEQQCGVAAGDVTMVAEGVLLDNDSGTKLWYTEGENGLATTFTITGWITAYWSSPADDRIIFDYYLNGSNNLQLKYDGANTLWTITKTVGGTPFTDDSASDAVATGDDVHFAIVQDATTLRLYINGVQVASVTATATMTAGGTIGLGCAASGTPVGADVALDGVRILPDDLTATQVAQLYAVELPIKTDGGQVGAPPYFLATPAETVGNVDDATYTNYCVIGGVGGDLEAKMRLKVIWAYTTERYLWLGLRAQDSAYDPTAYIWAEHDAFSGGSTTTDATASGGNYRTSAAANSVTARSITSTVTKELLFGVYRLLSRLKVSSAASVVAKWRFGGNVDRPIPYSNNKTVSMATTAFKVWDFGDVRIGDDNPATPEYLEISTIMTGTSLTVGADFNFLLPAPYAKVSYDFTWGVANTPIGVNVTEGQAWTLNASGGVDYMGEPWTYIGYPLRPVPMKYNYLFLMQVLVSSDDIVRNESAAVAIWTTPRYSLPGGMVA